MMGYLLGMPVDPASDELLVFEVDRSEVPEDLVLASPEPGQVVAKQIDRFGVPAMLLP